MLLVHGLAAVLEIGQGQVLKLCFKSEIVIYLSSKFSEPLTNGPYISAITASQIPTAVVLQMIKVLFIFRKCFLHEKIRIC